MTELEHLQIEHACARLQMRYGVFADRSDIENFTQLFAPDGSVTVPEHPPFVGHAAIRASIAALSLTGITMRHIITNCVVDVTGDGSATGSCYLIVYNSAVAPDETGQRPVAPPATIGEYADTFCRTSAGWRFQTRILRRVFRSG